MELKNKIDAGILTVFFEGHIDTANAGEVERCINALLDQHKPETVIIDAETLEYISSAGLRILLRVRKLYPTVKVINVSSAVYDILEMTGFTEMLDVEKAYRTVSIDGCEIIGTGANGIVYRLDKETIIKVYRNPDSLDDIQRERELARTAFVLGVPTAIPYDVVKVGDKFGSVFELIDAKSFAKVLISDPQRIDEIIDRYVNVLKKIHSTDVGNADIPDMKKIATAWAEFDSKHIPADKAEKLLRLISDLPKRNTMIHGDYHIKNIMLQGDEEMLIDMDTICAGHPVFELGTVYLAYQGFGELDHSVIESFLGVKYEIASEIWHKSLIKYFGTDDEHRLGELEDKIRIIAYTRSLRRTIKRDPDNTALIEHYKSELCELIDKVDSLEF